MCRYRYRYIQKQHCVSRKAGSLTELALLNYGYETAQVQNTVLLTSLHVKTFVITVKSSKKNGTRQVQGKLQPIKHSKVYEQPFQAQRIQSTETFTRKNPHCFCTSLMFEKKKLKSIVRSATPNQVHPGNYLVYCQLVFHLGTIICRFLPMLFYFSALL